jgi:homeobox protein YOX1/YHP1
MAGQQYQQHQTMSMTQRTMPSSRASTQLPYARPDIVAEQVVLPPDPVATDPIIKKKRKRADARQLEVLNATYARTAFPSTEERAALAKELDMSARSVQIWLVHSLVFSVFMIFEIMDLSLRFQNKRQQARQGGRSASTSSNTVSSPVPTSTPSSRDYRGSPIPMSPMVETSGPTYTSRSPPPAMMRSGQTPSPPGGRPDYSRHWPRGGY